MRSEPSDRIELLQGATDKILQVEHGSLYPAHWKQMADAIARVMWPVKEA
jgi:hypothetical protein